MSDLIDFHIHIDYYKDYIKTYEWFDKNGVYALFVTNLPQIYEKCLSTFKPSKYIKFALGYNPQLSGVEKFNKQIFNRNLNTTKYIGEVGLDFTQDYILYKDLQIEAFQYICKKSSGGNKILSIHSRNAEREALEILKANKVKFAVFHWYTGELELIEEILKEGYYFSINSSMLKNIKGKKIINEIPIDRILVETDGPFSRFNNKSIMPVDLKEVYSSFEEFFKIREFNKVVFNNLKNLLNAQVKLNNVDN